MGAQEILSALSSENLRADQAAFTALMLHLRAIDGQRHTVLMAQVENEVGMIPEARDHSAAAEAAFAAPVPRELTDYLAAHPETPPPALRQSWQAHGEKRDAPWAETFGAGPATDELFNAWEEARYNGAVAAAGRAVYPLPLYVNAALARPGAAPGRYPSGGPLPHLYGVWRVAAPALDMLSPDVYFPNFVEWVRQYRRAGNPLFIPETGRADAAHRGANALYAYGELDALGYSVYAPGLLAPEEQRTLGEAYGLVEQLTPLILASQGTGRLVGVVTPVSFAGKPDLRPQSFVLGNYRFDVSFTAPWPPPTPGHPAAAIPGAHGVLVIHNGADDFWVAGSGAIVKMVVNNDAAANAGIASIWEGAFVHGVWTPGRNLNGDDDNQGRYLSLPARRFTIRKLRLYTYRSSP